VRILSLIGVFVVAIMAFSGVSEAVIIEKGKSYSGGEYLEVAGVGVGFTMPMGWRGMLPENLDMFVMTPDNKAYIFVFARKMDKEGLKKLFREPIRLANGIVLSPTAEPFVTYREISVPYRIENGAAMAGYGRARQGPNGAVVGYIAAGPAVQGPSLAVTTRNLAKNTTFFEVPQN